MEDQKAIRNLFISVYDKQGIDAVAAIAAKKNINIISTGGTASFLKDLGHSVTEVSDITGFPSVFDGRVKTLHPVIFGGILMRRSNPSDLEQASEHNITPIDVVVVDLYPFEKTLKETDIEQKLIEKIDIGGISLIRAAAKNFNDVVIIPSVIQYPDLLEILEAGSSTRDQRKKLAAAAFDVSSHYDSQIFKWMNLETGINSLKVSIQNGTPLRYGENPHQKASFYADGTLQWEQLNGKELSYNNIQDIDAAWSLVNEFDDVACAIIKHTNPCGIAVRKNTTEAWKAALQCDPVSAYGGVIALNRKPDTETCRLINEMFFEVLIVPGIDNDGLEILKSKKNRIILKVNHSDQKKQYFKNINGGVLCQEADIIAENPAEWKLMAGVAADTDLLDDMVFGMTVVKHLKSNAIVVVKNRQMIGSGSGQTSRIDAVNHALGKVEEFGFEFKGATLISDAYFPFADSVGKAYFKGITAVVEPGGSVRDEDTVRYCQENNVTLYFSGRRHFKH